MKQRDRRRRIAWSRQIRDWLAVRGITLVGADWFQTVCKPSHFGADDPVVVRGEAGRFEGVTIVEGAGDRGLAGIPCIGPDTPFERTMRADPTDASRVIVTDVYRGPPRP
jgi:hypothetical protein